MHPTRLGRRAIRDDLIYQALLFCSTTLEAECGTAIFRCDLSQSGSALDPGTVIDQDR